MLQTAFINRRALYLRPDPARVIVGPSKPTTEPRDLNPTDKTRANHIVERVLNLDPEAAASQLADVLDNFNGRHRNLLETFELPADEMEKAFAAHGCFSKIQRQLIGAYFLNEYSFEASALFNPSIVRHPDQTIYLKPSRGWRRAYFIADVLVRHHRCGRQRGHRSDRASRIGPKSQTSGVQTQWRRCR